jgi:hypothetical protein
MASVVSSTAWKNSYDYSGFSFLAHLLLLCASLHLCAFAANLNPNMLTLPILRWGKPYESLEQTELVHFLTGEPVGKMGKANPGLLERDIRKAQSARDALRKIPHRDLIARMRKAAELFREGTLTIGDSRQSPDDFINQQSATTGLPENMCRANVAKNCYVLENMERMLDALTRGLPP